MNREREKRQSQEEIKVKRVGTLGTDFRGGKAMKTTETEQEGGRNKGRERETKSRERDGWGGKDIGMKLEREKEEIER